MYETSYHRPSSVDEAAALFAKGSESKYLAGGHTLIPVMKQRLASPSDVIDLARIKDLVGIEASGDTLTIKAPAGTWSVSLDTFDGKHIDFTQSDDKNPLLKVLATKDSVTLTTPDPTTFVYQ